jgi:hypothetical protein
MNQDDPLIFISYASPDRDRVLPFLEWFTGAALMFGWIFAV